MISKYGDGLGIAQRLAEDGNKVSMFIQDSQYAKAGKGIINRVPSWRPNLPDADLVICDMVGFGNHLSTFKRLGKPVFSCHPIADMLELDRAKSMELFEKVGINTPETYNFDSPDEARVISSIWEDPGFVIKPSGNISTAKTYVCNHPDIYDWALSTIPAGNKLIVQKIVEGIEVSTEGWFNGRDWIKPFNHTFEKKKFLDGDKGPNTGCMGNVVFQVGDGNKLVDATVRKLTGFLKNIGYRGPVDINTIITENSVHALEITARLGYDAIEALLEGLKESVTDLFFETALGVKKEMDISTDYLMAVRASLPPWPHAEPDSDSAGMPIVGINSDNLKHLYLTDVYKDGDQYLYAGGDGAIFKATAHGLTVKQAQSRVYRTIRNITAQDMQYRSDIGDDVADNIKALKEWGWL